MYSDEGQMRAACVMRDAADTMMRAVNELEGLWQRVQANDFGNVAEQLVQRLETLAQKGTNRE